MRYFLSLLLMTGLAACGEEAKQDLPQLPADDGPCASGGDCATGICFEGSCHGCDGQAGEFVEQSLTHEEEERFYYVYVPSSYECGAQTPVWFDFHGTGSYAPELGYYPETLYGQEELVALADEMGFVLVRPRSRARVSGGQDIYQWDTTITDENNNANFARAILETLANDYTISSTEHFASGFSSGANMVLQFARRDHRDLFRGLAPIGGGVWGSWQPLSTAWFKDTTQRVYFYTGLRDLHHLYARRSVEFMRDAMDPDGALEYRVSQGIHDIRPYALREAWDFWHQVQPTIETPLSVLVDLKQSSGEEAPAVTTMVRSIEGEVRAFLADGTYVDVDALGNHSPVQLLPSVTSNNRYQSPTDACVDVEGIMTLAMGGVVMREQYGEWQVFDLDAIYPQKYGLNHMVHTDCYEGGVYLSGITDVVWFGGADSEPVPLTPTEPNYDYELGSFASASIVFSERLLVSAGVYRMDRLSGDILEVRYTESPLLDIVAHSGSAVAVGHDGAVVRIARNSTTSELILHGGRVGSDDWTRVAVSSSGALAAVSPTGGLITSHDGGISWDVRQAGGPQAPALHDVMWYSDVELWITGDDGKIYQLLL